jgi:hypothetical protein
VTVGEERHIEPAELFYKKLLHVILDQNPRGFYAATDEKSHYK